MPTQSEFNQFRRYIGDYTDEKVDDTDIEVYLDDATAELTADFTDADGASAQVTEFDNLVIQYRPEVVVWASINFWWQKAALYAERHSQTVGQASQSASEKWERAMEMIRRLTEYYDKIGLLGTDITIGNLSRFSKITLTRIGGQREEDAIG